MFNVIVQAHRSKRGMVRQMLTIHAGLILFITITKALVYRTPGLPAHNWAPRRQDVISCPCNSLLKR